MRSGTLFFLQALDTKIVCTKLDFIQISTNEFSSHHYFGDQERSIRDAILILSFYCEISILLKKEMLEEHHQPSNLILNQYLYRSCHIPYNQKDSILIFNMEIEVLIR